MFSSSSAAATVRQSEEFEIVWVAAIMEWKTREVRDTIMMRYLAISTQIKFISFSLLIHIY